MTNFTLVTTTSTSLNFLIYVQNLYSSQKERVKNIFPSYRVPVSIFNDNFEESFCELWDKIVEALEENTENDMKLFYEQKTLFCKYLFNEQAVSTVKFEDIYRTFQNWWGSFAGSFAIERAADDKVSQLYFELTNGEREPLLESFSVSILYDDCVFAEHKKTATMAITSIPEIYIRYTDVVDRIFV